ncbi:MAG: hypothetical protein HQ508_07355 [Candidatus Marinimicrobia bacterium]|nr:hypothetical protein [Candidatus Neomarinimicrobiota bacterium]
MMLKQTILFIGLSALLIGQDDQGSSFDLNISAMVVDQIEVITLADIDAGIILPGQSEKIISPITDSGAGILRLEGQGGSSIQISYSQQITMTNLLTDTPLLMNYMISGGPENNQSASVIFTSNPATVALNPDGVYFIWVGCSFSLEGLVPGQYDGDFIVEVDYN